MLLDMDLFNLIVKIGAKTTIFIQLLAHYMWQNRNIKPTFEPIGRIKLIGSIYQQILMLLLETEFIGRFSYQNTIQRHEYLPMPARNVQTFL